MMAHSKWYLNPLSLIIWKKNIVRVRHPLAKLSGSWHASGLGPGCFHMSHKKDARLNGLRNLYTVKPVLRGHSKIDKTKILMTNGSLMKVKSIAECSPWSILQYF